MNSEPLVYIVDDDSTARAALSALVGALPAKHASFASAEEFLAAYDGRRPACVVTDLRMAGMNGLELQERLAARGSTLPIIVLTGYANTSTTVRAVKAGAVTVLEKPCNETELCTAIRTALEEDVARLEVERRQESLRQRLASLTDAERDVLDLMLAGLPNKSIARRLDISIRTVEVRRHNIFEKMAADSVAELVRMVMESQGDQSPPR